VSLKLDGGAWTRCERFDDGQALFTAVCELGFEGVVAKNHLEPLSPERSRLGEGQESELLAARS
jgi:ATP-dependent DNA ligase